MTDIESLHKIRNAFRRQQVQIKIDLYDKATNATEFAIEQHRNEAHNHYKRHRIFSNVTTKTVSVITILVSFTRSANALLYVIIPLLFALFSFHTIKAYNYKVSLAQKKFLEYYTNFILGEDNGKHQFFFLEKTKTEIRKRIQYEDYSEGGQTILNDKKNWPRLQKHISDLYGLSERQVFACKELGIWEVTMWGKASSMIAFIIVVPVMIAALVGWNYLQTGLIPLFLPLVGKEWVTITVIIFATLIEGFLLVLGLSAGLSLTRINKRLDLLLRQEDFDKEVNKRFKDNNGIWKKGKPAFDESTKKYLSFRAIQEAHIASVENEDYDNEIATAATWDIIGTIVILLGVFFGSVLTSTFAKGEFTSDLTSFLPQASDFSILLFIPLLVMVFFSQSAINGFVKQPLIKLHNRQLANLIQSDEPIFCWYEIRTRFFRQNPWIRFIDRFLEWILFCFIGVIGAICIGLIIIQFTNEFLVTNNLWPLIGLIFYLITVIVAFIMTVQIVYSGIKNSDPSIIEKQGDLLVQMFIKEVR